MGNFNFNQLVTDYFVFARKNPQNVTPLHAAVYFFAVNQCQPRQLTKDFWFPRGLAIQATGAESGLDYARVWLDLDSWGFIIDKGPVKIIESNQGDREIYYLVALGKQVKNLL